MYASVVCERHRALSVAAEAQVLPWVCRADDHAGLQRHRARGGAILQRETVSALPLVIPRALVRESSRKRSVEMRKQMEESAAAEGARRATGAAAGRGRGERFSARRKRAVVLRLLHGEDLESGS